MPGLLSDLDIEERAFLRRWSLARPDQMTPAAWARLDELDQLVWEQARVEHVRRFGRFATPRRVREIERKRMAGHELALFEDQVAIAAVILAQHDLRFALPSVDESERWYQTPLWELLPRGGCGRMLRPSRRASSRGSSRSRRRRTSRSSHGPPGRQSDDDPHEPDLDAVVDELVALRARLAAALDKIPAGAPPRLLAEAVLLELDRLIATRPRGLA